MAWNYDQGYRDILTIKPVVESLNSGDLYYHQTSGSKGMVGVVMADDMSGQPVGFAIGGCWMFDSTIQFAFGDDVYFHPEAGYHAHGMAEGYLSDSTADIFIGKCVRDWEAGYNSSYDSGGGFFVMELSRSAQGRS